MSAPQPRLRAPARAHGASDYVAARGIKDERILQAMRDVPRHLFVPTLVAAKAYGAGALPIGAKQTISQPYIVARMIELLELTGKEKVLEIGTGTGYQAVVLSKLCAKVFSIERINELALRAAELIRDAEDLQRLGESIRRHLRLVRPGAVRSHHRRRRGARGAGAAAAATLAHRQAGHPDRPERATSGWRA